MSISHIAMFKLKDGVTDAMIDEIGDQLSRLPTEISSIRSYRFGRDLGLADGNFDYGVVATFDDLAGYEQYRDDATHRQVIADYIVGNVTERAAIQFES